MAYDLKSKILYKYNIMICHDCIKQVRRLNAIYKRFCVLSRSIE